MNDNRIASAYILVCIIFFTLFMRYTYIQIFGHFSYLKQSINNYSSKVSTPPVRGMIIDSNNTILATNTISYAIGILPKDYKKNPQILNKLTKYANITEFNKKKFINQFNHSKNYDISIIKDDLSNTEIAKLTAHNYEFPEVQIFARTKRYYPFHDLYAHSIGYVAKISQNDLEKLTHQPHKDNGNYLNNDYIGKNGLEQYYEHELRGIIGQKIIQTDATGNEIGLISNTPAINGNTIQLSINNGLQMLAKNLLGDRNGAIVAIDPQDGGVLTFVSNPGFDPNWFIDGINQDDWSELTLDINKPLLNRASQSSFPPGSTFKPFLGLSALYLGYRTPNSTIIDPGYFIIPGSKHKFKDNDHPYGLGSISMARAIAVSSDTYFYKLAYEMGINNIDKGMSLFGFGSKTNIDLPNENQGLLPSQNWKAKHFSKNSYQKNWLSADSVTVGIGQGFNQFTPLQLAYATTIIANSGVAFKPHFIKKIISNDNQITEYKPEYHILPIEKNHFEFIKQAMKMAITDGTGRGISYGLKYSMSGKTGTAQVVSTAKNNRRQKFVEHKYKDHAWFIAFAPTEKPTIAVAVLLENGGWGGASAAPIARKLFDYYLLNKNNSIGKHNESEN